MTEFNPSQEDYIYHYKDYIEHIQLLEEAIVFVQIQLIERMLTHDRSKIIEPELKAYAEIVPGFKNFDYGTREHEEHGNKLGKAWKSHTEHNLHHPEHFPNGLKDMNLIDIVEMVCDWYAASMRKGTFDYETSLKIGAEKHDITEPLLSILKNTCKILSDNCRRYPRYQSNL